MCYNIARSRVLYLSSDCHFSYTSVIQLMYRGLGKRTLGELVELSSDCRLNLSRLSPRLRRHAHKHASATGPQRRAGGRDGGVGGRCWCARSRRLSQREGGESDRSQQSERARGRRRERTRGMAEKRESKTTGKVGEKSAGRKPPECFFRSGGTKGYSMTGVGVR